MWVAPGTHENLHPQHARTLLTGSTNDTFWLYLAASKPGCVHVFMMDLHLSPVPDKKSIPMKACHVSPSCQNRVETGVCALCLFSDQLQRYDCSALVIFLSLLCF